MRKQIVNPETGDWADYETAFSDGVVVHAPGHARVYVSGRVAEGDSIEEQTRGVLESIEADLADLGGSMRDVVRVRVYVASPHLDEESLETVHRVRAEFFEPGHYPASTLVEVEGLVRDRYVIEIDADAVVPDDGWETEAL